MTERLQGQQLTSTLKMWSLLRTKLDAQIAQSTATPQRGIPRWFDWQVSMGSMSQRKLSTECSSRALLRTIQILKLEEAHSKLIAN